MKKKISINSTLTTLLSLGMMIVAPVVAAAPPTAPTIDFMSALNSIVNWLFAILLVVAALFIIIAAFDFVTASGDADKTKKARDFVLYALIGVLVGFLAKGLIVLVGNIVGQ